MKIPRGNNLLRVLVFLVVTLASQGTENVALSPDGVALLAMKSSMGDPHGSLADWDESASTPCLWSGIFCDGSDNVIALNMSGRSLTGYLSEDIGSLRHLITLALDSNKLEGPLPEGLSLLSHLRFFNITNNNFSSDFPSGFWNLTKLVVLDCYNNNMSGKLPRDIVSLRSLQHIHLGGNNFYGSIPPEYGSFSSDLSYLSLSGNALTGSIPPQLGNLTGLQSLYLGWWNSFDGGIPAELGTMSSLVLVDFSSCGLTGGIPAEFGNLTQLGSIFLYNNNLTGLLPPELGNLSNLLSFDVSVNLFFGSIPDSFGNLKSLKLMSFFMNFFSGQIPPALGDLPSLVEFHMWENNLTGEIPQRLGSNGLLTRFDVSTNELVGGLPPDLCLGGKLRLLVAMNNFLSGPVPEGIANCESLDYIRLYSNNFNGSLPDGFFVLPNVSMLELNDNQFTGSLPTAILAPLLEFFDVSRNLLDGDIPDAVGGLLSLQTFRLEGNQFSGSIPPAICDMPVVYELALGGNSLAGEIPAALGNCTKLSKLDLSGNQLVGAIPATLGNLAVLAMLNLSRNHLSGRIPSDLGLIQSLTQVDFSYNDLSGPVPVQGEAEFYNETVYAGNPLLCGGVLVPCNQLLRPGSRQGSTSMDPTLLAWLVGAVLSASLVVVLVGVCCCFKRYRYYVMRIFRNEGAVRPWKFTPFQRLDFTADDIVGCLTEDNVIGKGGAGTVYKGQMPSGEMVAVKRLACGKGTSRHDHGFSAEIRTLGKIRHRFIVRLLGFCTNNEVNLLVYEFMPNGSLGEFLHGGKSKNLDWNTRYNVAVQAANGLCYLHHDCVPLIVHRDVKSNNILLDSELGARVADFGLAKFFQDAGSSESMSSIAGSYGYIAPEYAYTLKVNEKSDIYSFGVVLMELLTGRRPIEPEFGDGVDIVQWVRGKIQTKEGVLEILDPRIGASVNTLPLQEVMLVLRVALLCSSDHPVDRPTMRDVVQMLSDVRPGIRTSGGGAGGGGPVDMELQLKPPQNLFAEDLLTF